MPIYDFAAGKPTEGLRTLNRLDTPPYLQEGASKAKIVNLQTIVSPAFEHKMKAHWAQVRHAFLQMDKDRSGTLSKEELWECLHNRFHMPMTRHEFDRIFEMFDTDHSGGVDYVEFNRQISGLLQQTESGGVGHKLQERGVYREFGRCRNTDALGRVKWNNEHRQELAPDQSAFTAFSPVTMVKALVDGEYHLSTENEVNWNPSWIEKRFDYDNKRDQPLMTSLMQGVFYGQKLGPHTPMSSYFRRSHILKNISTVTPRRPTTAPSRRSTAAGGSTFGAGSMPFATSDGRSSRSLPATTPRQFQRRPPRDTATTISSTRYRLPQSKEELETLLQRRVSPRDAATLMQWLPTASEQAKTHLLRSQQSPRHAWDDTARKPTFAPTPPTGRPAKRPQTARSRLG